MLNTKGIVTLFLLLISSAGYAITAQDYIDRAKTYIEEDERRAGIIELKNALQVNPKSIEARLMLGEIYLSMGDGAAAEKELGRAKKLNANRDTWIVPLTKAHLLQQKFHDVLRETEEIETLPTSMRSELLVMRGDALLKNRKLDESLKAFEQARILTPEAPLAQVGIVMVQLANNQPDQAKTTLNELLKAFPNQAKALTIRGELHTRENNLDAALNDYSAALSQQPENIPALFGRASIYLGKGNVKQAKPDIEQLDTMVPGHPRQNHLKAILAFLQKNFQQAERHLQEVLKIQPKNIQSQLLMGVVSFSLEKYQIANEYLTKVNRVAPNHLPTVKLLASIRNKLNKIESLIPILESAAKNNPGDAQIKAMLGSAYMKTKRYSEGSQIMGEALEIEPKLASYRTQLAMGLLAQGKTNDAIKELQSTVDMGDDFIQADVLLVMSHLRNQETEKAITASKNLEKRHPNNPIGFNLSGLAYTLSKNIDEAERHFLQALKIDRNFVAARTNLARLEYQRGNTDKAQQYYEQGLELTPDSSSLLIGLAALANKQGDADKMQKLLAKAMEGKPSTPQAAIISAKAYLEAGKTLNALDIAGKASRQFPSNLALLEIYGKTLLLTGEPANAAATFQQMVNITERVETLSMLATAQAAAKKFSLAQATYKKIVVLRPDHIPAQVALVKLELQAGNLKQALITSQALQKSYPENSAGLELEGLTYAMQKQPRKAIDSYKKAFSVFPHEKLAIELARQYFLTEQTQSGHEILKTWIKMAPKDTAARLALATSLQSKRDNPAAIKVYEDTLAIDKDNLLALNNLAWLYSQAGDKRAVDLGKRAYDLAPKNPAITDTYGWILVQSGNLSKGGRILKEAVDMAPQHQEIGYHLGFALAKQGKDDEARLMLKKIIRIDPSNGHAKKAQSLLDTL